MNKNTNSSADHLLVQKRTCIARFMDENSTTFGRHSSEMPWIEVVQSGQSHNLVDRRVLDKALGMLSAAFRSAQVAASAHEPLEDMMSPERSPGIEAILPDTAAIDAIGLADDTSSIAFGRAITIYKAVVDSGELPLDVLRAVLDLTLDDLPAQTPLMHSVIETCRSLSQMDMDHIFAEYLTS